MRCKRCDSDTRVVDTRTQPDNTIKRKRVCENGHTYTTWESDVNPGAVLRLRIRKRRSEAKRRGKADPEALRANWRRKYRRQQARMEARETGEPVEQIYRRWGID